jgi:Icc-related predicted phosphoesterase
MTSYQKNPPPIAVFADLHGFPSRFEKIRRVIDEGIKAVFVVGDIATSGEPDFQRANVRQCFELLLLGKPDVRVFAIPGNDDWRIVEETMQEFPEVTVPIDRACALDETFRVVGYPHVPITPFMYKDYEKWDDERYPEMPPDPAGLEAAEIAQRINLEGYRSRGLELYDFRFDPNDRTDNILADVKFLTRLSDPQKTIYLFHCPPFGHFDFTLTLEGRANIGSRSICAFIRETNPWLTIHGHSHEAVSIMRGEYRFKIADSVGFSVGAGNDPTVLNGLLIDIPSRLAQRISG